MKNLVLFSAVSLALCGAFSSAGCSSSSTTPGTGGGTTTTTNHGGGGSTTTTTSNSSTTSTTNSTTTTTTASNPAPPTLGAQIDRFGRPAINTALNHAFDSTAAAGTAKDAYNQDNDPTKWGSNAAEFAKNLAILDALDGVCGNQLGYKTPASNMSYATLAGALAGDVVWLNTAGATCTTYLAVELNALGVKANTDCGGRALAYDVIDISYSALAGGTTPVTDGVAANDKPFLTAFPYLAAPF